MNDDWSGEEHGINKEMFPEAYIREEVGELTLRLGEAGSLRASMNTTNVGQ